MEEGYMHKCKAFETNTAGYCLIHNVSTGEDIHTNLTSPHDYKSWKTLLKAARVLKFKPLLELAATTDEGVVPTVFYHATCRYIFVHNLKTLTVTLDRTCCHNVDRNKNKKNVDVLSAVSAKRKQSLSNDIHHRCVFCYREETLTKHTVDLDEPLVTCSDFRADVKLYKYLHLLEMQKFSDMVINSSEVRYHHSCYERALHNPTSRIENCEEGQCKKSTALQLPLPSPILSDPNKDAEEFCIFCSKSEKYPTRKKERLVTCEDFRDILRIRECAQSVSDSRLLEILDFQHREACKQLDSEVKYHASCYKSRVIDSSASVNHDSIFSGQLSAFELEALEFVVKYIARLGIRNEVTSLADVNSMYIAKVMEYEKIDGFVSEEADLKEKLQQEFEDHLRFCCVENSLTLMYPSTLSFNELLEKVFQLRRENSQLKQENFQLRQQTNNRLDVQLPVHDTTPVTTSQHADDPSFHSSKVNQLDNNTEAVDRNESCFQSMDVSGSDIQQDERTYLGAADADPSMLSSNVNQMELDENEACCQSVDVSGSSIQQDEKTSSKFPRRCVIHIKTNEDGRKLTSFSDISWHMVCKFVAMWKDLDGIKQVVAANFDASTARSEGFHRRCYADFINKKHVALTYSRLFFKSHGMANMRKVCQDASVSYSTQKNTVGSHCVSRFNREFLLMIDNVSESSQLPETSTNLTADDSILANSSSMDSLPALLAADSHCKQCVCHIFTYCNNDEIKSFDETTWSKLSECMAAWKEVGGKFHRLAAGFDPIAARNEGYHERCFLSFTDERKLGLAKLVVTPKTGMKTGGPKLGRNVGECFICCAERFGYDRISRSKRKEKLICCHPKHKGNTLPIIRDAALRRGDQLILDCLRQHDEEPGFVLKYHKRCLGEYKTVRVAKKPLQEAVTVNARTARTTEFDEFCVGVIDKRIIERGEMLTVRELRKLLVAHVEHSMGCSFTDSAAVRSLTVCLRRRLFVRYGDQIGFFLVNGQTSIYVVNSATLHRIVAIANGSPISSTENLGIGTQISKPSAVPGYSGDCDMTVNNAITASATEDVSDDATASSLSTSQHPSDVMAKKFSLEMDNCNTDEIEIRPVYQCIGCRELFESIVDLGTHKTKNQHCRVRYYDLIERAKLFNIDVGSVTDLPDLPPFKCDICFQLYHTLELLKKHKITYHHPLQCVLKLFRCKACNKWFREQAQYDEHVKSQEHQLLIATCCRCLVCGRRFGCPDKLKQHSEQNSNCLKPVMERYYRCQYCLQWLTTATNLKYHTLLHLTRQFKVFRCTRCAMEFRQRSRLEAHMGSEHGVKCYCCEVCDKRFATNHGLRHHKVIHDGFKSFLCEFCSTSFSFSNELHAHIARRHSDARPYSCQECNKTFVFASSLRDHMKCHSTAVKLKPFVCEFCGKAFCSKVLLKQHTRSHTIPYCCEICGERFAHSWIFKKHSIKHLKTNRTICRGENKFENSENFSDSEASSDVVIGDSVRQQQVQQSCTAVNDNWHSETNSYEQSQGATCDTTHVTWNADIAFDCEEIIADTENSHDTELFFASIQ